MLVTQPCQARHVHLGKRVEVRAQRPDLPDAAASHLRLVGRKRRQAQARTAPASRSPARSAPPRPVLRRRRSPPLTTRLCLSGRRRRRGRPSGRRGTASRRRSRRRSGLRPPRCGRSARRATTRRRRRPGRRRSRRRTPRGGRSGTGSAIRWGKKLRPVSAAAFAGVRCARTWRAEQLAAPGCSRGTRRRAPRRAAGGATCVAVAARNAVRLEARRERVRQRRREPDDHQREEDPDREHLRRVLEGLVHAGRRRRGRRAGRLFITPARFGEANAPIESPIRSRIAGELRVGEVDRQQLEQHERRAPTRACRRSRTAASRSGRRGSRRAGPASRNPSVSGSM